MHSNHAALSRLRRSFQNGEMLPRSLGEPVGIVERAKSHFLASRPQFEKATLPSLGPRWETLAGRTRESIGQFSTVEHVIRAAQSAHYGFEFRRPTEYLRRVADDVEESLANDFPHFANVIAQFADTETSLPESLLAHNGRLVSWPLYANICVVMRCLSHIAPPATILEIGGGTGGPARTWLTNPIGAPARYVIIDLPESLFFSEVFLSHHFGAENVSYVVDAGAVRPAKITLIPLQNISAVANMPIDFVLNTLSMQEMTEEWVDFYMVWLDTIDASHFYSLNYFAQPLSSMQESANTWSPHPSPHWQAEFLLFNTHRAPRQFAEMMFRKRKEPLDALSIRMKFYDLLDRAMTQQNFLELMDCVREVPEENLIQNLVDAVRRDMHYTPKELWWLAAKLNRPDADAIRAELARLRAQGTESVV